MLHRTRNVVLRAILRARLLRHGLRPREIGILAGIRKSGNTYLRFLLANYVVARKRPLSYSEMTACLGGDLKWSGYRSALEALPDLARSPDLSRLGIRRFYATHVGYDPVFRSWKLVHVYRNPLDYLVSFFFYKYAYRPALAHQYSSPVELLHELDHFFETYTSFAGTSALRIAYEDLYEQPAQELRRVLTYLGALEIDEASLQQAVANSRAEVIRAEEDQGHPIHSPPGFTGRFVRDSSIGQHRTYFGAAEWEVLSRIAARHGVPLGDFRFEPKTAGSNG